MGNSCPTGYTYTTPINYAALCVSTTCPSHSTASNPAGSIENCICDTGYTANLLLPQCAATQTCSLYAADQVTCVSSCPTGMVVQDSSCVCPQGQFILVSGVACGNSCSGSQFYGLNYTLSSNYVQYCLCNTGYARTLSGDNCVSSCPANSSPVEGACQCNTGYTLSINSNTCVSSCPANSSLVGGQCRCNTGYTMSANQLGCDSNTGAPTPMIKSASTSPPQLSPQAKIGIIIGSVLGAFLISFLFIKVIFTIRKRRMSRRAVKVTPGRLEVSPSLKQQETVRADDTPLTRGPDVDSPQLRSPVRGSTIPQLIQPENEVVNLDNAEQYLTGAKAETTTNIVVHSAETPNPVNHDIVATNIAN